MNGESWVEEVSAGGVVFSGDRVLVLRTRAGTWVMPKGHVEPGESTEAAALREVYEETGLSPRIILRLGSTHYPIRRSRPVPSVAKTVHWFIMDVDSSETRLEPLFAKAAFLPVDVALKRLTHANDRNILHQADYVRQTHPAAAPKPA